MNYVRRAALNEWILARKAEGLWVTHCPSCGWYFAQKHAGRPAVVCQKHRCFLWRTYQQRYNHAPPEWMRLKWEAQYAEAPRKARMQSSIVESVEVAA
jgi:hypothetical protein